MAVDIDSFLNKFEKEIKENKDKVNLEFQKDVEDRISKIQEDVENKDIKLLKEIYDVIKKFDEDLPNKFLGIENRSGLALSHLGEQYSSKFLDINSKNAEILKSKIKSLSEDINNHLKNNEFDIILKLLKEIKKNIYLFPKPFLDEKTKITKLVKEQEIEVYNLLEIYKEEETKRIKKELNNIIQELKKNLIKKDIHLIEKSISEIKIYMNNIPKIILSHFTQEKIKVNKILVISENYLEKCYEKEFNYRLKVINLLIEKFHTNAIKKQVKTCVLIYNEILIEFKAIPDVFLKRKIEVYRKVNKIFTELNNLVIKSNIEMFLEGYNNSKKIETTREYLRHVKESKTVNHKNLNLLKEEIKNLPKNYNDEQYNINKDIEELSKNLPVEINTETNSNKLIEMPKLNISNDENMSKNVNLNMLKEIDIYYKRLKKSNNEEELNKLYEKILFYLKLVKISKEKKREIFKKVKTTLKNKNIGG